MPLPGREGGKIGEKIVSLRKFTQYHINLNCKS